MRYKEFGGIERIYKHIKEKINFTQNCRKYLEQMHMMEWLDGPWDITLKRESVFYAGESSKREIWWPKVWIGRKWLQTYSLFLDIVLKLYILQHPWIYLELYDKFLPMESRKR